MITMQEFTEWFATKMLIWPWHNNSDDISVISEQLKGITSLATDYGFNYTSLPRLQTKNSNIHKEGKPAKYLTYNLYKTNIPFGYLDGGVFALHCQETEEIVIMMIYGSD